MSLLTPNFIGAVNVNSGGGAANAPAWALASAYAAGDIARYTDGEVYYANAAIPANTPFAAGITGATWRRFNASNPATVANATVDGLLVTQDVLNRSDLLVVAQTTASRTFTLPTGTTNNRTIEVVNTGTALFNVHGCGIHPGRGQSFLFNGTAWVAAGETGVAVFNLAASNNRTDMPSLNRMLYRITGTVGHSLRMPAANTLNVGATVDIINDTTQADPVLVWNSALTGYLRYVERGASASFVLTDNSSANGTWVIAGGRPSADNIYLSSTLTTRTGAIAANDTVQAALEKLQGQIGTSGSPRLYTSELAITALSTNPAKPSTRVRDKITVYADGSGWSDCVVEYFQNSAAGSSAGGGVYRFSLPAGVTFDVSYYSGLFGVQRVNASADLNTTDLHLAIQASGRVWNNGNTQQVDIIPYQDQTFTVVVHGDGEYGGGLVSFRQLSSTYFPCNSTIWGLTMRFRFKSNNF